VNQGSRQRSDTLTSRDWNWVETSIWTDAMLAALDNGVKGNKWFSLVDKVYAMNTLQIAWDKVRRNAGAAGIDQQSTKMFEHKSSSYLEEIREELMTGKYEPSAVKRVHIPKGNGKTRPLGIPTVKDRVVQMAIKLVVEPIFEKEFISTSFGFRPGKGAKDALRAVDELVREGHTHVVDVDFQSYFDLIPHDKLMDLARWKISDGKLLCLLERFLEQEVMEEHNLWVPDKGTPQGAVLSPLLANLYLHPLDLMMQRRGFEMRRYADDFVVLCKSEEEAQEALRLIKAWSKEARLVIHREKTHVADCSQEGQGFDFLGYHFTKGKRYIRKKSLKAFKDKIREKTRRTSGKSIAHIIKSINPMIRGWFNYFKHAEKTFFRGLDGFTRRRLRSILRKMNKKPGQGHTYEDHKRWPNVYFAKLGLFTMVDARAAAVASQSRCGNC
jgi:RNA-directed DNA polymerase